MTREEAKNFAEKKAYELSFILLRVGERVKQEYLGQKLQNYGIKLLEETHINPTHSVLGVSDLIEKLLKLGAEGGLIHRDTVEVIIGELKKLNSAIAELQIVVPEEVKMDFSKAEELSKVPAERVPSPIRQKVAEENPAKELASSQDNVAVSGNGKAGQIRQTEILEKIRQVGSCRMKDMQEYFPQISERTIRYDLGRLVEQGEIERLGNGGPNTFYRLRSATRAIQVVPGAEM